MHLIIFSVAEIWGQMEDEKAMRKYFKMLLFMQICEGLNTFSRIMFKHDPIMTICEASTCPIIHINIFLPSSDARNFLRLSVQCSKSTQSKNEYY